MSRKISGFNDQFTNRAARGGACRVARLFVPGYNAANAIALNARSPRRAIARRQLARLIEPRRMSS